MKGSHATMGQTQSVATRPGRFRQRYWLLAGTVVGLLGGGTGLYFWQRLSMPVPPSIDFAVVDPAAAEAIQAAQAELRKSPRSADAWGKLGILFLAHEFVDEGMFCFTQAERLDPEEPRWLHLHGYGLSRSQPELAISLYRRAANFSGATWDAPRVRLAELLLTEGRVDEAEPEFHRLLAADPQHPRAHLGLARVAFDCGDYQASLQHIDRCASSSYSRKAAQVLEAIIYGRQGKAAFAAAAERRAASFPPDDGWPDPVLELVDMASMGPMALADRASRLMSQDRQPEAVALLRLAAARYRDKVYLWVLLGHALITVAEYPEAEEALQQAVQLSPDTAVAHYYLGTARFGQGKPAAAAECFRKATELQSDYDSAWYLLGECSRQQGDRAGAVRAYQTVLRCRPYHAGAHKGLGRLLADSGQKEEALSHLRRAVEFNPADAEANLWLAEVQKSGAQTKGR